MNGFDNTVNEGGERVLLTKGKVYVDGRRYIIISDRYIMRRGINTLGVCGNNVNRGENTVN